MKRYFKPKNLLVLGIFLVLFGISYAFFEYMGYGEKHRIIAGDIYMNLTDSDTISLTSIYPETKEEARSRDDNYIIFTIEGTNESKKDIYYKIGLSYGNEVLNMERFNDHDLVFDLYEIVDEEDVLVADAKSFSNLNTARLFDDTIIGGTTNYSKTYKLRMWLGENVLISDSIPNATYSASTYNNHYASVKVKVEGSMTYVEEEAPNAKCFDYSIMRSINNVIETNVEYTIKENLDMNKCVDVINEIFGPYSDEFDPGETIESFCDGSGTLWGDTFEDTLSYDDWWTSPDLEIILNNGLINKTSTNYKLNIDAVDSCVDMLSDGFYDADFEIIESFCMGETLSIPFQPRFGLTNFGGFPWIDEFSEGIIEEFIDNDILIETSEQSQYTIVLDDYWYDMPDCEVTENIVVPRKINGHLVEGINNTFSGNNQITSIEIPDSVIIIWEYAFYDCPSLISITIPNSVTSIGQYAFSGCTSLESIEIPNSVTSIGDGAFESCTSLTNITIPNSVTSIGDVAFYNCTSLTSITIPNSVTSIGDEAFYNCENLHHLKINKSASEIRNMVGYSWRVDSSCIYDKNNNSIG